MTLINPGSHRRGAALRLLALLTAGAILCACASTGNSVQDPAAPPPEKAAKASILLVLTNHGELGDTGGRTGAYLSEAAQPWAMFEDEGYEVTLASPNGGQAPLDPKSLRKVDSDGQAFLERFATDGVVTETVSLSQIDPAKFDAIFFVGGHGTMWDFPTSESVRKSAQAIYDQGGILAGVCHGPAAFVQLKTEDGKPLVAGRRLTGFTDNEERAGRVLEAMPFLLETRLRELGAEFDAGRNFRANVVVDDRIITGQNPESVPGTAREVISALAKRPADPDR